MRSIFPTRRKHPLAHTRMVWLPGAFDRPRGFRATRASPPRSHGAASRSICNFVDLELDHLADRSAIETARPRYRAAGARGGLPFGLARGYLARRLVRTGLRRHRCRTVGRTVPARALSRQPPADRGNRSRPGCLAAWQPGPLAESDEERRIWRFIQARGAGRRPSYLGYGGGMIALPQGHRSDGAGAAAGRREVIAGGHDWADVVALCGTIFGSEMGMSREVKQRLGARLAAPVRVRRRCTWAPRRRLLARPRAVALDAWAPWCSIMPCSPRRDSGRAAGGWARTGPACRRAAPRAARSPSPSTTDPIRR